MRLVFAGTPAAAVPSLAALLDSGHQVVAVLTRPDAAAGRGLHAARSPVGRLADEHGIEVLSPARASDPAFLARLAEIAPDCCAVVAYGALLRPAALAIPRFGWVNLHFSVLPAWRGAAPVQHAVLRGDEITGASTFLIEEGLDTGPVLGTLTEPVRPTDTAGDLLGRLAVAGAGLLLATMDAIAAGTASPVPQPSDGVSLAPKITVEDARVRWVEAALSVDRRIRACTPEPGAWTTLGDQRLKLGPVTVTSDGVGPDGVGPDGVRPDGVRPDTSPPAPAPGELVVGKRHVLVGTATRPVALGLVQAPGKRPMPAADWARGARPAAGERLA
jgi:methionyl-tRNA formyltransferase